MKLLAEIGANRPLMVDVVASLLVGFLAGYPLRRNFVSAVVAAIMAITSLAILVSWLLGELRHPFSLHEYVPGMMFVLVPLCLFYYLPAVVGASLNVLLARRSFGRRTDAPRNV